MPTHVRVPSVVSAPLGTTAAITVRVTADGTSVAPAGYVALWNVDIPSAARFVSHTVALDAQGVAVFRISESLPGVPFSISGIKIYYVPTLSMFAASTSPAFVLEMSKLAANLSVAPSRSDGNGGAVPLMVSSPGASGAFPVGDLTLADASTGGVCTARLSGALRYDSAGQAAVIVDLPAGHNVLTVNYLGDAYFASQQAASAIDVTTPGRVDSGCPTGWARLVPPAPAPSSGGDLPMLKYGFPRPYGQYNPQSLSAPDVGTLVVGLAWSDVEPARGQFDFSRADAEVQAAIAQGKKVALVLRFQSGGIVSGTSPSCAWNFGHAQLIPKWVADALGASNSFCSHGTALTIPKYWSASFIALWTGAVEAIAAHFAPYASDVAYVRGPVGLGDEAEPITGPDSKPTSGDRRQLLNWGYNPQLWEAWQEDMLTFYREAFWYAPWVLYTINHQDLNNKCNDAAPVIPTLPAVNSFAVRAIPCTGRSLEIDVAEWAVDHGFGLAQNSLDSSWIWRDPVKADPSAGHVNQIFAHALGHSPRPLIELETYQAETYSCNFGISKGLPHCGRDPYAILNTESDISYARSHGVTTIEWYEDDLANPKLRPIIDLWRQIQAAPGQGKIPTVVGIMPDRTSVKAGAELRAVVSVSAPGVSGFYPGGTVTISDDITGHHFKTVTIPPNAGSVTVKLKMTRAEYGHVNLSASYVDKFQIGSKTTGTWLWLPSTSSNQEVIVSR